MSQGVLLIAYEQHSGDLLGFLTRRLRCRYAAADLLQDLYVRLIQMEAPCSIINGRAYLYRMAANLATDHIKVESRRRELLKEHQVGEEETDFRSPERDYLAGEQLQMLGRALQELPERSRRIFFANRFEGKTQKNIALEFGVSTTTVENHIRRVFNHLANVRDRE